MKNNPYIGPWPFERDDRANFYGRKSEARVLGSLIRSEREVLFYATSGAGKTSLLNAAVIPELEEDDFAVLPVARLGSQVPPDIDPATVDNVFVYSALLSLVEEDADAPALRSHRLGTFLEERTSGVDSLNDRPVLLIVDQLEEIFTAHHDRWQDAEGFFRQMREALDALPDLGVLLVVREDHLAGVDPYAPILPRRLQARFRMERLGAEGALAAVSRPADNAGCPFEPDAAKRLVDDLRRTKVQLPGDDGEKKVLGPYVEPVQLQVVCRQLWESLPEGKDDPIHWGEVEQYGGVDRALTGFYQSSLDHVMAQVEPPLAPGWTVTESQLRRWFGEQLVTPQGTRGLAFRDEKAQETAGLPNAAAELLENQHIIRAVVRAGARWYELAHDRLIEPVQADNAAWRQAHLSPLQHQAALWDERNRRARFLLWGRALEEAEEWASTHEEDLTAVEREFLAASQVSWQGEQERAKKRRRLVLVLIALGVVLILGVCIGSNLLQGKYWVQEVTNLEGTLTAITVLPCPPGYTPTPDTPTVTSTPTDTPTLTPTPTDTPTFTVTPSDTPTPMCAFSIADATAIASAGIMIFPVELSTACPWDVSVGYATADGTAIAGKDYASASGRLVIPAGQATGTIRITLLENNVCEGDESFTVELANPVSATLGKAQGIGTILADEPSLSIADASADESAGTMSFPVELSVACPWDVRVDYETADGAGSAGKGYATAGGTAIAGKDFTSASGRLVIPAGQATGTLEIALIEDTLCEGDETLTVKLADPVNATLGKAQGTGTILADEPFLSIGDATASESAGAMSFPVELSTACPWDVSVDYATADGTATAEKDYGPISNETLTIPAGEMSEQIEVTLVDDSVCEGDESFTVELANPVNATLDRAQGTGTILADEPSLSIGDATASESAVAMRFPVKLSAACPWDVRVGYETADGTATAPEDYDSASGPLDIPAGRVRGHIEVTLVNDTVYEGNETFTVKLAAPVNATLGDAQGTGIILDDDDTPKCAFDREGYIVSEDVGTATITVTLSGDTALPATCGYDTSNGTATAPEDYESTSGTLEFPPGDTIRTFPVTIVNDTIDEEDETVKLSLSNPADAELGQPDHATLIITDNDPMPTISIGDASACESEGSMTFPITLSAPGGLTVSARVDTKYGSATDWVDYTPIISGKLSIPAGETSGQVAVEIYPDSVEEITETFTVELTNPVHADLDKANGTGTIRDCGLELDILSSPYAALDHNKPDKPEGPNVFVVQAVVTNTSSMPAENVSLTLDYRESGDWQLLPREVLVRSKDDTLGSGKSYHAYWFATYPPTVSLTHSYQVTAEADNLTWITKTKTVQTVGARAEGSTRMKQWTTWGVGGLVTATVNWNLGSNFDRVVFGPAGNGDFDPSSYRLVGATVTFTKGAVTETIPDRLYFDPVPAGADGARAKFVFQMLQPTESQLCPYASLGRKGRFWYDKNYCDSKLIIATTSTRTSMLTATVHAPAVLVTKTDGMRPSSLVSMRLWLLGLGALSLWGGFRIVHGVGKQIPRGRSSPRSGTSPSGVRPDE